MHSERALDCCRSVAKDVVCKPDPRFGQECRAIAREGGLANGWCGIDNAVGEIVVGGATLRLVPTGCRLNPEAGSHFKTRRRLPGIFYKAGTKERTPAEFSWRGNDRVFGHSPLLKGCQRGERGLPKLVLRQEVVRLQPLEPGARFDLMLSVRPVDVIVYGVKIARGGVVAAGVCAGQCDLRGAIRCGAAGDDDGTHRPAGDPAGNRA